MPSPHDALFRHTFSRPAHAAGLLRSILSADVARGIDWTTLAWIPGTRVDPILRRHQSDLLFKVQRSGLEVFLYVLVEHKRHGSRWSVFQLLEYVVGLWRDLRKELLLGQPLPRVLPILVVQAGDGAQPPRLADLFEPDGSAASAHGMAFEAELDAVQPQFAPYVVHLQARSQDLQAGLQLTLLAKLTIDALVRLPGATAAVARIVLASWSAALRHLIGTSAGKYDVVALWSYIGEVVNVPVEVLTEIVEETMDPIVVESFKSPKEQWREQGREEGREEGMGQGLRSGRCEVLSRMLRARFGELSADVVVRLEQATIEQLDDWAVRLLDARSLTDVFGG